MTSSVDPLTARSAPPVADLPDRACNGADPRIFYPPMRKSYGPARAICAGCPHRQPCLDWALETRQGFGFWGGATPEERLAMIREAS
jgi:WhiB family redox-sensing transcriptional regulator